MTPFKFLQKKEIIKINISSYSLVFYGFEIITENIANEKRQLICDILKNYFFQSDTSENRESLENNLKNFFGDLIEINYIREELPF